jgi:hypothetical protein
MKKLIVVGLISSVISAGAFAAVCATTNTAPGAAVVGGTGSATVASTAATEYCVCDGASAGSTNTVNGGGGTVILPAGTVFVKNGFNVQCSANTVVSYDEVSATQFVVAGGSRKGNQTVKGSSNGGGVIASAKCAGTNDACIGTDVTAAWTAAKGM